MYRKKENTAFDEKEKGESKNRLPSPSKINPLLPPEKTGTLVLFPASTLSEQIGRELGLSKKLRQEGIDVEQLRIALYDPVVEKLLLGDGS